MPQVLQGIRVLDLTQNIAGPFCTQLLGDFGAEVVKVERPGTGDDARHWTPPEWAGVSTAFLAVNRNKKSVAIDIAKDQGRALVRRLAQRADVLVHATRPGSLEAKGLGYDDLKAGNPRLVYCAISAFGDTGPLARAPGYDPLLQAYTGIMSVTGHPDRPPARAGVSLVDMGTGLWAFAGILAALYRRQQTGEGGHVAASLLETGVNWMALFLTHYMGAGVIGQRLGDVTPMTSPYETFRTQDKPVLIAAANDSLFAAVCRALGAPEVAADPRFSSNAQRVVNRPALHALLEARTSALSAEECVRRLREAGAPCSKIQSVDEVYADPQVNHMAMIRPLPGAQIPGFKAVDIGVSIDGEKASLVSAPPPLGAHTDEVLQEAGLSKAEIDALRRDGAIG